MANDFDEIPVRLPSGTKAVIKLPRVFTIEDGVHLMNILSLYITDKTGEVVPLAGDSATREGESK